MPNVFVKDGDSISLFVDNGPTVSDPMASTVNTMIYRVVSGYYRTPDGKDMTTLTLVPMGDRPVVLHKDIIRQRFPERFLREEVK